MRLDGKRALITGASGGLGAHFAKVCARAGADVLLTARRAERLEVLAKEIQDETGRTAFVLPCDITDGAAVEKLFNQAQAKQILPDVIINNAGLSRDGWSWQVSETDWQMVMDVNLTAVWRVAKLGAAKWLEAKRGGSIVNIASILSFRTSPMLAAYGVSKAGVAHLTKAMGAELARHNIRVNALAPGYFPTEMNEDYLETPPGQKMKTRIPAKRFGALEDLTAPLLLLASDAGSYIIGETICVDGGHLQSPL